MTARRERIRECIGYNLCVARRYRKFPVACVQNPAMGYEGTLGDLSPRPSRATSSSSARASRASRPRAWRPSAAIA